MLMFAGAVRLAVLIVSALNVGGAGGVQADGAQLPGITGRIVDGVGCPLIIALKLRPATAPFVEGALQEAQSDMDGRFAFTNVAPGQYWIHYDLVPNGIREGTALSLPLGARTKSSGGRCRRRRLTISRTGTSS